jgi:hypothetical protein
LIVAALTAAAYVKAFFLRKKTADVKTSEQFRVVFWPIERPSAGTARGTKAKKTKSPKPTKQIEAPVTELTIEQFMHSVFEVDIASDYSHRFRRIGVSSPSHLHYLQEHHYAVVNMQQVHVQQLSTAVAKCTSPATPTTT